MSVPVCVCEPEVFDESVAGSETADTQRQEDPTSGVGRLGRIQSQLLAYLTVDLVPGGMETRGNEITEEWKHGGMKSWGNGNELTSVQV